MVDECICALLETEGSVYRTRDDFSRSFYIVFNGCIILFICGLPTTVPYMLLAFFLLIQNISAFRFRKYEQAYSELKQKQLT